MFNVTFTGNIYINNNLTDCKVIINNHTKNTRKELYFNKQYNFNSFDVGIDYGDKILIEFTKDNYYTRHFYIVEDKPVYIKDAILLNEFSFPYEVTYTNYELMYKFTSKIDHHTYYYIEVFFYDTFKKSYKITENDFNIKLKYGKWTLKFYAISDDVLLNTKTIELDIEKDEINYVEWE